MIHLDTNVAVSLLNGRSLEVRAAFDAAYAAKTHMALSILVFHELMFGAAGSIRRDKSEQKATTFLSAYRLGILPFDLGEAREAADIRADLKSKGTPIGPYDLLIAAQARRAGATLITANTREFLRVPGLQVVDWSSTPA